MQHITALDQARLSRPSVVTIGAFDGVHRGHQYLIGQLLEYARVTEQIPVVLTFFPHPELVLRGFRPGFYLTLPDAKACLLGELGVNLVVTHPFDDQVRQVHASVFVGRLLRHLKMASLWVGANFALGYQREGNVDFLRALGYEKGFELRVVDLMDAGGEQVSSSRVREALKAGEVSEAKRLLGRSYRLPGIVIRGAGRGQKIGIPTANLSVNEDQLVPGRGVYGGWASLDELRVPALINVGLRPTFEKLDNLIIEAHLLDYNADLYGQRIKLEFLAHLRSEKKFGGEEELRAQIRKDIEQARSLFGAHVPVGVNTSASG